MIVRAQDPIATLQSELEEKLGAQRYNLWFRNVTEFTFAGEYLRVAVADRFIGQWIERRFERIVLDTAEAITGNRFKLQFHLDPELGRTEDRKDEEDEETPSARENPTRSVPARPRKKETPVPPPRAKTPSPPVPAKPTAASACRRGTLSNFIVGASNELAVSAAKTVVEHPADYYNPLFIHGGCGLGKTHLLQAIFNGIQERHPHMTALYVTGEEFTNDYIQALRSGLQDAFRRRYRDVDALVIDDVHFFASKRNTQEEFLHTFNTVFTQGKQVVLSSDAHPKMIKHLSDPLVSRLVSGMVARVDAPDLQVRLGVLRQRAKLLQADLDPAVIRRIAEGFRSNVRELEGALLKVVAMARLTKQALTLSVIERALGELTLHAAPRVGLTDIERVASDYFGLKPSDLHSPRKTRVIALARNVAMYLARKHTDLSYPEIGRQMGGKSHSTVILAYKKISQKLQCDQAVTWTLVSGRQQVNVAVLVHELEERLGLANPASSGSIL